MTRLDKARNILDQYNHLVTILDQFYWEGAMGQVMYFTDEESEILAEYLMNNGIVVPEKESTHNGQAI